MWACIACVARCVDTAQVAELYKLMCVCVTMYTHALSHMQIHMHMRNRTLMYSHVDTVGTARHMHRPTIHRYIDTFRSSSDYVPSTKYLFFQLRELSLPCLSKYPSLAGSAPCIAATACTSFNSTLSLGKLR